MSLFKILALGDSVVWGQGLEEPFKWDQIIKDELTIPGRTVELASLARSGAVIDLAPTPYSEEASFLFGELPRSWPGILSQLEIAARNPDYLRYLEPEPWDRDSWRKTKEDLKRQVQGYEQAPPDLILLDGGINDLKALQIVLPWSLHDEVGTDAAGGSNVSRILAALDAAEAMDAVTLPELHILTDEEFKALIDRFVFERMRTLLDRVAAVFPHSLVVVTGYFPIFTEGSAEALADENPAVATLMVPSSDRNEQRAALASVLHGTMNPEEYANLIVHRSLLWYRYGTDKLREAVAEANSKHGDRFALASPVFGPENGALAADSFLWTLAPIADYILREILRLFGARSAAEATEAEPEAPEEILDAVRDALSFSAGYGLGAGLATDEVTVPRGKSALRYYVFSKTGRNDANATLQGGFTTSIASTGHPNPDGVEAYVEAIKKVLGPML